MVEVRISIHDLKIIGKALKCYLGTSPDWEYPYTKDKCESLTIEIHGIIEDYNYQDKHPPEPQHFGGQPGDECGCPKCKVLDDVPF